MNFVENTQNIPYKFNRAHNNTVTIDNITYHETTLLTPLHYRTLQAPAFTSLNEDTIEALLSEFPLTEQIYLGSGKHFEKAPERVTRYLHSRSIAIESAASSLLPAIHLIMMEEERNFLMIV